MIKRLILAFAFFAAVQLCFANGAMEHLGMGDLKVLSDNIIKWNEQNITSYSCKVLWAAGNRPDTLLELRVVDKKVVGCTCDGRAVSEFSGVQQYTVDELHATAKKYVRKNRRNAQMLHVVQYDPKYGYITSFARIYNPKAKDYMKATDYSYRIKVYDFVPDVEVKR